MLNLGREWLQLQLKIDMLFNVVRTIFDFVLIREKTVQWKLVFLHITLCLFGSKYASEMLERLLLSEVVVQRVFCKKVVLRNFTKFTRKHLYHSLFKDCNFIKKETLAQVFSCEFRQIAKYSGRLLVLLGLK